MKTVLVTGANGFVGVHTLKKLSAESGIILIAGCRNRSRLPSWYTGEVREGDFRDEAYLQNLLEGVDVVVNAMSWSSLWGNKKTSRELFLKPCLQLIEAYMSSTAYRFVNISSTSVAVPGACEDAMAPGLQPEFWPHLCNVIKIENYLREQISVQEAGEKTVINMRLGLFAGEHYALGLLPVLVPRMKTHLVPWVSGGKTGMPIIDGRDIGQAMALAAMRESDVAYESYNVVGPSVPEVRQVIEYIATKYNLPAPHFNVPFSIAYPFAWLMEKLDRIVPWEPLITRSIIHLLEETHVNNDRVSKMLGYRPEHCWQTAISAQMDEMLIRQKKAMKMSMPVC